jgi:hypothetical protein
MGVVTRIKMMLFVEVVLGKEKARSKIMHSTLNPKETRALYMATATYIFTSKRKENLLYKFPLSE